ncbi:MAG: PCRF domain-containing protein, partial [Aeromicrobium sp.]
MAITDFPEHIKTLGATLTSIEKVLDLDKMRAEIGDLQELVAAPDLWDDQANAQRVTGRLSVLQSDLERIEALRQRIEDMEVLAELAHEEGDADSRAE